MGSLATHCSAPDPPQRPRSPLSSIQLGSHSSAPHNGLAAPRGRSPLSHSPMSSSASLASAHSPSRPLSPLPLSDDLVSPKAQRTWASLPDGKADGKTIPSGGYTDGETDGENAGGAATGDGSFLGALCAADRAEHACRHSAMQHEGQLPPASFSLKPHASQPDLQTAAAWHRAGAATAAAVPPSLSGVPPSPLGVPPTVLQAQQSVSQRSVSQRGVSQRSFAYAGLKAHHASQPDLHQAARMHAALQRAGIPSAVQSGRQSPALQRHSASSHASSHDSVDSAGGLSVGAARLSGISGLTGLSSVSGVSGASVWGASDGVGSCGGVAGSETPSSPRAGMADADVMRKLPPDLLDECASLLQCKLYVFSFFFAWSLLRALFCEIF